MSNLHKFPPLVYRAEIGSAMYEWAQELMFLPSVLHTSSVLSNRLTAPLQAYFVELLYGGGADWAFYFCVTISVFN